MQPSRMLTLLSLSVVAALGLAACGGGSPFAATSINGSSVVLEGTVLNRVPAVSASFSSFSFKASAAEGEITVSVLEDPNITTTVGDDGTFVLRGLPEGEFTLVFADATGELGTLTFSGVNANQELIVSVEVDSGGVVLVEERRNGIGHGDIEIQGTIDEIVTVDPAGDSVFIIAGYEVVARPGDTGIRKGGRRLSVEDLQEGDQVHVKGVWLDPAEGLDEQPVLAHEIKLQDEAPPEGEDPNVEQQVTICHIPPGNPSKKKTKTVGASAVPAHLAHGDTLGPC